MPWLSIYLDRRIIAIFLLGIMSGLPWVMIGSCLSLWLKDAGLSRTNIGFAGLIFAVYSINFLWSPLLDKFRIPLHQLIGKRRSWIILCQLVIAACCFAMSAFEAQTHALAIVSIALILAIGSATQDIAIDAFRIDNFASDDEQGISAAAAATTAGWWTGYAAIGYLPLTAVDALGISWPTAYMMLGGLTGVIAFLTFFLKDPSHQNNNTVEQTQAVEKTAVRMATTSHLSRLGLALNLVAPWCLILWAVLGAPGIPDSYAESSLKTPVCMLLVFSLLITLIWQLNRANKASTPTINPSHKPDILSRVVSWLIVLLVEPLSEFFQRNGVKLALSLLIFVFVFKMGEAFLGRMSIIFYKDIGFSTQDIATYSKLLTGIVTIACVLPCGILNGRFGVVKGLFISGCAMAASNLMFIWLAKEGPNVNILALAVIVDGFTSAWASVATVSFLSKLCNHAFSATQYALLASLGTLGRTTVASNSGLLIDYLQGDWSLFFLITTLMVIPGLLLLFAMRHKIVGLSHTNSLS